LSNSQAFENIHALLLKTFADMDAGMPSRNKIIEKLRGESMIFGLRTVTYAAPDLAAAKAWYAKAVGKKPYFDQPFYVGFNVGGFELGLVPDMVPGIAGTRVYWGVDDIEAETKRLVELGGTIHEPIQDVGEGIKVVGILDPFGNVFALICNPYFKREDVR
jgi:predicted enzyme related to lactoylglutathione lyase